MVKVCRPMGRNARPWLPLGASPGVLTTPRLALDFFPRRAVIARVPVLF